MGCSLWKKWWIWTNQIDKQANEFNLFCSFSCRSSCQGQKFLAVLSNYRRGLFTHLGQLHFVKQLKPRSCALAWSCGRLNLLSRARGKMHFYLNFKQLPNTTTAFSNSFSPLVPSSISALFILHFHPRISTHPPLDSNYKLLSFYLFAS